MYISFSHKSASLQLSGIEGFTTQGLWRLEMPSVRMLLQWETSTEEVKHPSPLWEAPLIILFTMPYHQPLLRPWKCFRHGYRLSCPSDNMCKTLVTSLNLCKSQASDFLASILQSFTSLRLRHPKLGLCTGSTHSLEQLHLTRLGIKHPCLSTQQKSCVSCFYYVDLFTGFLISDCGSRNKSFFQTQ